ncbi:MAG TPA: outer membrane beta-barrel protein [Chitinophagaceae bacterium]|nr:outer membrane beta-barrel protein [Chitinophagaceae bacterium]
MRKIYLSLLSLFVAGSLFAQKNGSIKGVAFDTLSKQTVASATVTVVEKKDSSLVTFTMTDNKGYFELKGIPNGEYRLLITHISYHNSNTFFTISDAKKNLELGNIVMNDRIKVLQEAIVGEAPPVTMINDTVQYNASSFKTQPNASVEQLLKKLPGVKVEKDGTIKAQGEKVNRVLVDGKEFFGNDPKLATKNLPADAIDKVQVYDKQSDQAQLTGFEDGNYEKTINLKLKKDKKKGVFGKVSAGAGTDGRYQGKFNVNSFKGARQLSTIGMGNNTNTEGFSFMDMLNFSGELARLKSGMSGGGNININISGDDAAGMGLGGGGNRGINTTRGGGINYNNIIGTKLDFQSNYFYNMFNPNNESHIQRQYLLPDSSYFYNQNSYTDNITNNHRLNLNMLYQLDSMTTLRITPSFSYQLNDNRSNTDYETLTEEKNLTNKGFSNTIGNNEGFNFRNDIIYRKKFSRKGRTLSLSLQTSLNKSHGGGNLSSINTFYNPNGTVLRKDSLEQTNTTTADLLGYNARIVYTEPLWRKSLMEFSVGRSNTKNTSQKITHDYNKISGKYDMLNNSLTNDFENEYSYTNGGFRTRTQKKKYNYALGITWQEAELKGKIISGVKDSLISKKFDNLLPNARFQYNFSKYKSLSLNYNTSTNQPTMAQLQPVPDNSNSLLIREGNPDLKQEFVNTIQAHFNAISPYKNRNFFGFFTFMSTRNKIVNYDTVNQFGVRRTKPVNVKGAYNMNGSLSYSMPVRFLKGTIEFSSNGGYSSGKQFINTIGNTIKTLTLGPGVRLDMTPSDKLNLGLGAELNYNKSKYSLRPDLNNSYFSQEYSASVDLQLPARFFFSTDFTYTINTERATGFNTNVPMWNASISKGVMKFNRGELRFSAQDLLNRNIGISRNSNQNYIEDSRVKTLRRFFLLTFTYSLSKTGLNTASSGGMRMITR